jgi:tellurite resistance protein
MERNRNMEWIDRDVTLDAPAAVWVLSAIKAVAAASGNFALNEQKLVAAFEATVPKPAQGQASQAQLADLQDAATRAMILVALADGNVNDAERDTIIKYGSRLRLDVEECALRTIEMRRYLTGAPLGPELLWEAVFSVARSLGWTDEQIDQLAEQVGQG